jgi:hypothetical protein
MAKRLYTEACIRDLRPGGSIQLGKDALATPAALDLAFLRGIKVHYSDGSASPCLGDRAPASPLNALLENDGTYVVEVRAGVPTIHRLTPEGPVSVDLPGT